MELTTEIVRELLDYDQETGIFVWKVRERHWFNREQDFKRWNARFAGEVAGTLKKGVTGYVSLTISVFGKLHKAHRLVFIWMGEVLPDQVDHLNRKSLDNRWKNLDASSAKENTKNKSRQSNNTSGVTGVSWNKATGKWSAQVWLCGKKKHLGLFTDLSEAAQVVKEFRLANGYSDGHGKELAVYLDNTSS